MDDDGIEFEMPAAKEYKTKISHQNTRVRCGVAPHFQSDTVTLPLAASIDSLQDNTSDTASPSATEGHSIARMRGQSSQSEQQLSVILPELRIPTMSGELRYWMGFSVHFNVTIHKNDALPRIDKLKYLITYLSDQAKEAIKVI